MPAPEISSNEAAATAPPIPAPAISSNEAHGSYDPEYHRQNATVEELVELQPQAEVPGVIAQSAIHPSAKAAAAAAAAVAVATNVGSSTGSDENGGYDNDDFVGADSNVRPTASSGSTKKAVASSITVAAGGGKAFDEDGGYADDFAEDDNVGRTSMTLGSTARLTKAAAPSGSITARGGIASDDGAYDNDFAQGDDPTATAESCASAGHISAPSVGVAAQDGGASDDQGSYDDDFAEGDAAGSPRAIIGSGASAGEPAAPSGFGVTQGGAASDDDGGYDDDDDFAEGDDASDPAAIAGSSTRAGQAASPSVTAATAFVGGVASSGRDGSYDAIAPRASGDEGSSAYGDENFAEEDDEFVGYATASAQSTANEAMGDTDYSLATAGYTQASGSTFQASAARASSQELPTSRGRDSGGEDDDSEYGDEPFDENDSGAVSPAVTATAHAAIHANEEELDEHDDDETYSRESDGSLSAS